MPVNFPLGTNLSELLAQGRNFAQGLPSTVESGLAYLGRNAEPISRGLGKATSEAFLTPPGYQGWKAMGNIAESVGNRIGGGFDFSKGPVPDISIGRQPTLGIQGGPFKVRDAGTGNLGGPKPPQPGMPSPEPSPLGGGGLDVDTQTTLGDAARLGYLTSPQPGFYKVDRLGESPFYTNQQEALYEVLRKEEAKRKDFNNAEREMQEVARSNEAMAMAGGNFGPQESPNQPSPTPEQGAEGIKVEGRGFDWSSLQPAFKTLGEMGHQLSRPGADRPYAQMGFDAQQEEEQKHQDLLRKEQMAQEQMQAENSLRAREIGSRYDIAQMGDQSAMERQKLEGEQRLEQIRAELQAKGDPNAQVSDTLRMALGVPPGQPMTIREAALYIDSMQAKAQADQSKVYSDYLKTQGSDRTADNTRQGIEARLRSLQMNPMAQYDPKLQDEIRQLQEQLTPGVKVNPYTPATAPPPPPPAPGVWDRVKGFFGGGEPQGQPSATPGPQAQGGMTPPPQPNPVPLEVFRATANLPQQGATIVQQIFAQHGSDPATLKYKLQEFVRSAPPEYRQAAMEAIAPLIARM
jgi:hypothetical protein